MNRLHVMFSIAFVVSFTMISGCIPPPSLNPIFTDQDIVYDPDLVGEWTAFEEYKWTFQKGSGDFYQMTTPNDKGIIMTYVAYLGKIKDTLYLDIYLDEKFISEEHKDLTLTTIPVHRFLKMKKTGMDWEISMMSYDWFKAYIEENPDAIAIWNSIDVDLNLHNSWGPEMIITASTEELQKFLIKCESIKGAFNSDVTSTLKRIKPKEK